MERMFMAMALIGDDDGPDLHEDEEGRRDENERQRTGEVVSDGLEVVRIVGGEARHEQAVVFTREMAQEHIAVAADFFDDFS